MARPAQPGGSDVVYDVIIVGGGPAGLSAALILGRALRSVCLYDAGRPRNRSSRALHGYLTRDGLEPAELLRLGRAELRRYGTVFHDQLVTTARKVEDLFEVTDEGGEQSRSRKLLVCTGLIDVLPDIESFHELYGRGIYHCPYCDGFEHKGRALAAFSGGTPPVGLALSLRAWSDNVTLFSHGEVLKDEDSARLDLEGIQVVKDRVTKATSDPETGLLNGLVLESGVCRPCEALFFSGEKLQQCDLPEVLGCRYHNRNRARSERRQRTNVEGLYLAGDVDGDVEFVIVAAAEGAIAAVAINLELQEEDRVMRKDAADAADAQLK